MQVDTAIELIHSLIFFPEFEFKAVDHSNRFEGTIKVRIEYDAWDTAKEAIDPATGHYNKKIHTYAEFPLLVEDVPNEYVLYRRLINALLALYAHEAREALRARGTLWSPFHPHRVNGMKHWKETSTDDVLIDLMPDFTFGVC